MNKKIIYFIFFIIIVFSYILSLNKNNFKEQSSEKISFNKKITTIKKNNYSGFYKVLRVVDGDTIILDINSKKQRVRLAGINTPESMSINNRKVECFGIEAKKQAKKILNNKKIYFEVLKENYFDKYRRLLGFIFLKSETGRYDINFSKEMIKNGYGYEFTYKGRKYKYQKEYKKSEEYARENKKGLWKKTACKK